MFLLHVTTLALVLNFGVAETDRDRVGPFSVNPNLDCAVRTLAAEFSDTLIPWANPSLVRDALRLKIDCNVSTPEYTKPFATLRAAKSDSQPTFYADPVKGDDNQPGTITAPFLTVGRALEAARSAGMPASIVLRDGIFYIPSTIALGSTDSGLTISAYANEIPVLSAGTSLGSLSWSPSPIPSPSPPPPITGPFQGSILDNNGGGCVDAPGASSAVCSPLGQFDTAAICAAACVANSSCTGYTWHDTTLGSWAKWCYSRLDGYHTNDGAGGHVCGWKASSPPVSSNVWVATVPASVSLFDTLFMNGRRLVRARWPNANPSIM